MNEPTVIRASSLSGYADCPRRAAAKLFHPEIEAAGHKLRQTSPSVGATVGTAVHRAASVMLTEKAATGALPPANVSDDAAIESLRTSIAKAEGLLWDRETPVLSSAEHQVRRMARSYRAEIAPEIEPLIVEERLEAQVSDHLVLSGQSDVIAREKGRVRDLKTGKRLGNHAPQLGAYALLARSNGIDVQEAGIDYIARVSMKKPQPEAVQQRHAVALCETAAINVLRHIEADLKTFREGDVARDLLPGDPWAFLANPSSILCSQKWCPAFGTSFCHEHAAITSQETE